MGSGPAGGLGLPRNARLKNRRDFSQVRSEGKRVARGCLIVNWRPLGQGGVSRLGVVTGRSVGGAVQRSRARRLLREVYRLHQHDFERPTEVVLVARASIIGKSFAQVEQDFLQALHKRGALKNRT